MKSLVPKALVAAILLFVSSAVLSQEIKKETKTQETKMERFSSKTGTITKFIDTKLTSLKLKYGGSDETRIRKLITGNEAIYFYQIENQGKYNSNIASIEYADLLEIIKAMNTLKVEQEKDLSLNPDYLENKFTTVDGFQVGYFVSKGKSTWYLKLEKYGSDNMVFMEDGTTLSSAFNEAKLKIEELKK